jgi:Trk-type K+ transport system membrane component
MTVPLCPYCKQICFYFYFPFAIVCIFFLAVYELKHSYVAFDHSDIRTKHFVSKSELTEIRFKNEMVLLRVVDPD